MPAMNVAPFDAFLPTTEGAVGGGIASGANYETLVDVRLVNHTAALSTARVGVTDGTTIVWLCQDTDIAAKGSLDVWFGYPLSPGWQFFGRASASNSVKVVTGATKRFI